jgi:acyl carrier protein
MDAIQTGLIDEESIRKTVRQLILELAPNQSIGELASEQRLVEDLQYHSLALLEMAFTLEDELGLEPIKEDDAQKIKTVGEIEQYVINELKRLRGANTVESAQPGS